MISFLDYNWINFSLDYPHPWFRNLIDTIYGQFEFIIAHSRKFLKKYTNFWPFYYCVILKQNGEWSADWSLIAHLFSWKNIRNFRYDFFKDQVIIRSIIRFLMSFRHKSFDRALLEVEHYSIEFMYSNMVKYGEIIIGFLPKIWRFIF